MPNSGKHLRHAKSAHQQNINFFVWTGILMAMLLVALMMWLLGRPRLLH